MTFVAIIQLAVLAALIIAVLLWAVHFPYPSPLIRRLLSPRLRWPEMLIRGWLKDVRVDSTFLKYFNRDPDRTPPQGNSLLAPADGLVTSADIREGVRYLVIALSFWDMHVQRSPVAGKVVEIQEHGDDYMDGEGRQFAFLREKACPVQKRVVLQSHCGQLAVRLITSLAARRIETWVGVGDQVERGERIGRILLGSTVVLELPAATNLLVRVGDRVSAGETPVAEGVGV